MGASKPREDTWMFPHLGDIHHADPLMQVYACSCGGKIAIQREYTDRRWREEGTRFAIHHFQTRASSIPYWRVQIGGNDLGWELAPLGMTAEGRATLTTLGAASMRGFTNDLHQRTLRGEITLPQRFDTLCQCGGDFSYTYDTAARAYTIAHRHPDAATATTFVIKRADVTGESYGGPIPFMAIMDQLACEDHLLYGGGRTKDGYTVTKTSTVAPDAAARSLVTDRPDDWRARERLWSAFEETMRRTNLRNGKSVYEEFADLYDEEVDRQQVADRLAGLLRDRVESPTGARAVVSALTDVLRQRIGQLTERGGGGMPRSDEVVNPFRGLYVCVTGVIPGMDRDQAKDALASLGARSQNAVDSRTNYLIVGDRPGRVKVTAAKGLGVPTYTADEFLSILRNSETLRDLPNTATTPFLAMKPRGVLVGSVPVNLEASTDALNVAYDTYKTRNALPPAGIAVPLDREIDPVLVTPGSGVIDWQSINPNASQPMSGTTPNILFTAYAQALEQMNANDRAMKAKTDAIPTVFVLARDITQEVRARLRSGLTHPAEIKGGLGKSARVLVIGGCDEEEEASILASGTFYCTRNTEILNDNVNPITHVIIGRARPTQTMTEQEKLVIARVLLYAANMAIPLVTMLRHNGTARFVNVWETPTKEQAAASVIKQQPALAPKLTINPNLIALQTLTVERMVGAGGLWMLDSLWTGSARVEMNAEIMRLRQTLAGSWVGVDRVSFFLTPDLMRLNNDTIANINKYKTTVVADDLLRALFPTCWMQGKAREEYKRVRARQEEEARLTTVIIHERRARTL